MRIGLLALTSGGRKLAARIAEKLPDSRIISAESGVASAFRKNWNSVEALVCVMAAGVVVRSIARLLKDKRHDPAVVVLDEKGTHVISLIGGHLAGANALARRIAGITGGTAVITTASDTLELAALDLWAVQQGLSCTDPEVFTNISAILVNRGLLRLYCDVKVSELPSGLRQVQSEDEADLVISHRCAGGDKPVLHPRNLVVGIGCNRNTPAKEFEEALQEFFGELGFSPLSVRNLSSISVKSDEAGLLQFARDNGWDIEFFGRDQINSVSGVSISQAARQAVGAIGVAEPTALLSAQSTQLLSRKRKWQNITMAVAMADFTLSAQVPDRLNI